MNRYFFMIPGLLFGTVNMAAENDCVIVKTDGLMFEAMSSLAQPFAYVAGITDAKLTEACRTHVLEFPNTIEHDALVCKAISMNRPISIISRK